MERQEIWLSINETKYTLGDIAKALGIAGVNEISLCQEVESGTLRATTQYCDIPYPGIDIELRLRDSHTVIPITKVEQEYGDGNQPVAYLYGRLCDSYIAYEKIDDRDDSAVDENPKLDVVVVSGDFADLPVIVKAENRYVRFE